MERKEDESNKGGFYWLFIFFRCLLNLLFALCFVAGQDLHWATDVCGNIMDVAAVMVMDAIVDVDVCGIC